MPLNDTVLSDLVIHTTGTKMGQASGSGGSGIVPIIYMQKINFDFFINYLYLYLYPAIRLILISGIICIRLSGRFYYPELSVSGSLANFTIRASLIGSQTCLKTLFTLHQMTFECIFGDSNHIKTKQISFCRTLASGENVWI